MKTIAKDFDFIGPFAEHGKAFIRYKQLMGYKYKAEISIMRRFCAQNLCGDGVLTKDIVLKWCEKFPTECVYTHRHRTRVIRQFSIYLEMMGCDAYIVPKQVGRITASFYTPFIFTREMIQSFFSASDELSSTRRGMALFVYPILMRLLYGCGLRISEALSLRIRDVDLKEGILSVQGGKANKDRRTPMSPSLTQMCRVYAQNHLPFFEDESFFFPAPDGGMYSSRTIYSHFRKTLEKCGIPHLGKGKGPRLHDLRHTFSVHCLNRWVEDGKDLYAALPVLAAYLGHTSIFMTQRYLRLTAEVYPMVVSMVEKACVEVIPKRTEAL